VREAEAFPSLTADQVERVASFGVVQWLPRGTVLFEPGARRVDFFLVLDGSIEAYASRGTTQQVVHVYGEQQFTGELNLFNDRATLVGARMGCDGRVARLNGAQFRRLLAAEPDIANVVMRAFILRRERIIVLGHTAVTIIAPRHSAKLLHLQGFLTRNRQPYLLADPEVEAEAAAQLSELGYVIDDTPVVLCGDDRVLVCPTPRELGVHHVRLPHPSYRGGARTHHRASAHRGHRAEWRPAPGHRYVARSAYRAVPDPPYSKCVSHARGRAEHRVAQLRRLGRQRICANGCISRVR
jgi:CRP-like cAMP-binding protein